MFLHYETSVRGQGHSVAFMFMTTYKFSTHNIVMLQWVLFVVGTYITPDKPLQYLIGMLHLLLSVNINLLIVLIKKYTQTHC